MNLASLMHPRQFLLNGLFVVWALYAIVSGHLVPPPITALLQDRPPVVAVTDPPDQPPIADAVPPET